MSTERPDIACFTETWLKDSIDDSVIDISDYSVVRKDRSHAQHGGVCMYIKNGLKFSRLNEYEYNSSNEVLWCKLQPHRLPRGYSCLIIAVVYHPQFQYIIGLNSFTLALKTIFQALKRRRDRFETAIFSCQSEHVFMLKSLTERLKRDFDDCKSVSFQFQSRL